MNDNDLQLNTKVYTCDGREGIITNIRMNQTVWEVSYDDAPPYEGANWDYRHKQWYLTKELTIINKEETIA